ARSAAGRGSAGNNAWGRACGGPSAPGSNGCGAFPALHGSPGDRMPMHATVAVCTWNRAALLDRTLEQFTRLRVPAGLQWELLVVNNNCTDDTDQVLGRYRDRLPLSPLFEPRQGLSHARNCAVQAAAGDLIVWTDDDVLVDPDWLGCHVAAAQRWPEAA